jgi:hypothetical protein
MATTRNLRDGRIIILDGSGTAKTLTIPISEGDFAFTINRPTFIVMNRGKIDSRKQGDEVPVDLSFSIKFEQWAYSNGNTGMSVPDVLQGINLANDWISTDGCGPYAVDIKFEVDNPCDPGKKEVLVFGKFTADTLSFKEGSEYNSISVSGKALQQLPTRTYV